MSKQTADPLGLAGDAPLFAAYLASLERRASLGHPFITPGHKGSLSLTGSSVAGDLGLSGGVDTVKLSHGHLEQAEALAASLWGADFCRFSVGGSTHGNQALALSVGQPGDEVIVSRTLHRSMLIGLVLAGLRPVWVRPAVDPRSGLPGALEARALREAIASHPGAVAIFVGEPSYVGTFGPVTELAAVAHEAGLPLVIDAAWAAHFGFHPDLPPSAIAAGADAMVTSAHKVLPSYSQAALVLTRGDRIDKARLGRGLEATYTTSPAGQILASIDASRALLAREGEQLLGRTLASVAEARRRLQEVEGLEVLGGEGVDPTKLVLLLSGTGAHGVEVEEEMIARGMPLEMADRDTLVALVTLADTPADVAALTEALIGVVEKKRGAPRPPLKASWSVDPETVLSPREAFFAPSERVTSPRAVGRVSAELIAPYPPGVPVLAPGELVTEEVLAALLEAKAEGVRVAYAGDPSLTTLEVVRQP